MIRDGGAFWGSTLVFLHRKIPVDNDEEENVVLPMMMNPSESILLNLSPKETVNK